MPVNRYKRYLPVVAALLVAAGVSLDQYGIDLRSLAGGGTTASVPREAGSDAGAVGEGDAFRGTGSSVADYPHWSDTSPNINLRHVFQGEINRSGKAVGYHARPGGQDPTGARVASVRDVPNRLGVYTARVEIRDGDRWLAKNSSFFPDALSEYLYLNVDEYRRDGTRDTVNGTDGIAAQAGDGAYAAVREATGRYVASLVIGVDPTAVSGSGMPGGPGAPGGSGGEPPSGPPPDGGEGGLGGPTGTRGDASLVPG